MQIPDQVATGLITSGITAIALWIGSAAIDKLKGEINKIVTTNVNRISLDQSKIVGDAVDEAIKPLRLAFEDHEKHDAQRFGALEDGQSRIEKKVDGLITRHAH
jgi:hypothetical protein